jgi:phage gp45-like
MTVMENNRIVLISTQEIDDRSIAVVESMPNFKDTGLTAAPSRPVFAQSGEELVLHRSQRIELDEEFGNQTFDDLGAVINPWRIMLTARRGIERPGTVERNKHRTS